MIRIAGFKVLRARKQSQSAFPIPRRQQRRGDADQYLRPHPLVWLLLGEQNGETSRAQALSVVSRKRVVLGETVECICSFKEGSCCIGLLKGADEALQALPRGTPTFSAHQEVIAQ